MLNLKTSNTKTPNARLSGGESWLWNQHPVTMADTPDRYYLRILGGGGRARVPGDICINRTFEPEF